MKDLFSIIDGNQLLLMGGAFKRSEKKKGKMIAKLLSQFLLCRCTVPFSGGQPFPYPGIVPVLLPQAPVDNLRFFLSRLHCEASVSLRVSGFQADMAAILQLRGTFGLTLWRIQRFRPWSGIAESSTTRRDCGGFRRRSGERMDRAMAMWGGGAAVTLAYVRPSSASPSIRLSDSRPSRPQVGLTAFSCFLVLSRFNQCFTGVYNPGLILKFLVLHRLDLGVSGRICSDSVLNRISRFLRLLVSWHFGLWRQILELP